MDLIRLQFALALQLDGAEALTESNNGRQMIGKKEGSLGRVSPKSR